LALLSEVTRWALFAVWHSAIQAQLIDGRIDMGGSHMGTSPIQFG